MTTHSSDSEIKKEWLKNPISFFNSHFSLISMGEDERTKNHKCREVDKNFLTYDWWETATPEDVRNEIKKGADVNAIYYDENFDRITPIEGHVLSTAIMQARNKILAYHSSKNSTSKEITLQDIKTDEDNIRTLINYGADVNAIDDFTIGHLFSDISLNILNILIDAGLDVNKEADSVTQEKLINIAARFGEKKVVKRLLEAGARDTRTFMEKIKTHLG